MDERQTTRFALLLIASISAVTAPRCGVVEKLANRDPIIHKMYALSYILSANDTTTVIVVAEDPDGDILSYTWSKTGGSFLSLQESERRIWQAPSASGSYEVSVIVRDENGGETRDKVSIVVRSDEPPYVDILAPIEGESIPAIGCHEIEVRASHQTSEIERVDFFINGALLYTDRSHISNLYSYDWNTGGLSGPCTIVVKAYRLIVPEPPGVDSVHVMLEGVTPFPLRERRMP